MRCHFVSKILLKVILPRAAHQIAKTISAQSQRMVSEFMLRKQIEDAGHTICAHRWQTALKVFCHSVSSSAAVQIDQAAFWASGFWTHVAGCQSEMLHVGQFVVVSPRLYNSAWDGLDEGIQLVRVLLEQDYYAHREQYDDDGMTEQDLQQLLGIIKFLVQGARSGDPARKMQYEEFVRSEATSFPDGVTDILAQLVDEREGTLVESNPPDLGVIRAIASSSGRTTYRIETVSCLGLQSVEKTQLKKAMGRDFDTNDATTGQRAYLEALEERVGIDPAGRQWEIEFSNALQAAFNNMGDGMFEQWAVTSDQPYVRDASGRLSFYDYCQRPDVKQYIDSLAANTPGHQHENKYFSVFGQNWPKAQLIPWTDEELGLIAFCQNEGSGVMADAIREGRSDFAGLTHKYVGALTRRCSQGRHAPADCYTSLQALLKGGSWAALRRDDWTGFVNRVKAASDGRGGIHDTCYLTVNSSVEVFMTMPASFASNFMDPSMDVLHGQTSNGPENVLIRFLNFEPDGAGVHSPIDIGSHSHSFYTHGFRFPPLTLFAAVGVEIMQFEYDGTHSVRAALLQRFGKAPDPLVNGDGKLHLHRKQIEAFIAEAERENLLRAANPSSRQERQLVDTLLTSADWSKEVDTYLPRGRDSSIFTVHQTRVTVQGTFLLPAARDLAAIETQRQVQANHQAYGSIYKSKMLADTTELRYGDRLSYVRGINEVTTLRPLTMGEEFDRDDRWVDWKGEKYSARREWSYVYDEPAVSNIDDDGFDEGHDGWRLADFHRYYVDLVASLNGDTSLVPTMDEVAAARLYTGPAYVVINAFLRLVSLQATIPLLANLC
eukprot:SAG31_NODE_328_length_17643_cov_46.707649_3_plen_832_part_00